MKRVIYGFLMGLIGFIVGIALVPVITIGFIIYITGISAEVGYTGESINDANYEIKEIDYVGEYES